MNEPEWIWIVERVREQHYGADKRVVSWHRSPKEAADAAEQLQAEFDQACERVWAWYEVVETVWDMLHVQEYEKHAWVDCGREDCDDFNDGRSHQHHVVHELEEHEDALIAQLTELWHEQRRAWQIFVEDEVFVEMADPPHYAGELTRQFDETVSYVYYPLAHDPAMTRALRVAPDSTS